MKKKPTSTKSKTADRPERWPAAFSNPAAIIEHIEHESIGVPPADLYRARIEKLMVAELEAYELSDPDGAGDAQQIRETTAGLVLETASRRAGFVLGFEYCRDLIVSGAAKGGAR